MLKKTPSLAQRASLVFMSVYIVISIGVLAISAAFSWADRGEGNLSGPGLAIEYAAEDIRQVKGRFYIADDSRLAGLAARNPNMWLIVVKDERFFTSGAVPDAAQRTVAELQTLVSRAVFRLPGVKAPLDAVSVQPIVLASGPVTIAAGGVDPATLSTVESIDILLNPAIIVLVGVIAAISLLAMPFAIPAFTRALSKVTQEASTIGPHNWGNRIHEENAPKEVLPLVRGFNSALERLETELGRRRRFIADAAHELRTPLAVLSLRVDSLADEDNKFELQRSVKRLTNVVSQMLDLERLTLSARQSSMVDLVANARDVVADFAPMAITSGYDLTLVAPDTDVVVSGDPHAISRAIINLINNSIVHGGESGQITVVVGHDLTIDVIDEGPGVPTELQPRLFEPFSRGNPNVEGCGLGLHLTSQIMSAHGGIAILMPTKVGTQFRLDFKGDELQTKTLRPASDPG